MVNISWYLVVVNGLIDSLNPCAIGVLLLYLTIMLASPKSHRHLWTFGIFYIASVYVTYLLIGLGIFKTVSILGISHIFVWLAALVAIAFGLVTLIPGIPGLTFLKSCKIPQIKPEFTLVGALLLGLIVGVTEFPCSGAIYLATIGLLCQQKTFFQGLGYLLVYNLMFVLPLIIIFLAGTNQQALTQIKSWQRKHYQLFKRVSGILMLALGIGIILWLL